MTLQEFQELESNHCCNFFLFYLEKPVIGRLIEINQIEKKYYILPLHDLERFNKTNEPDSTHSTKVQLESIIRFTPFVKDSSARAPTSIPPSGRMPKKMVIFGAGASFDFSNNLDLVGSNRPPLTKDIFSDGYDEILRLYPAARNLSSEILAYSKSVEDFFQEQWERFENYPDFLLMKKLISTQYYLYELFRHVSVDNIAERRNHYNLLSRWAKDYADSRDEHVLLVSFNYDVLIETALTNTCDYRYDHITDYVNWNDRKVLLFKPHGSCNWIRGFKDPFPKDQRNLHSTSALAKYLYDRGYTIPNIISEIEDEITINIVQKEEGKVGKVVKENFIFPQMLIPYKDKDDFVMPEGQTKLLKACVNSVEEILIIGWKGTEAKFQDILSQALGNKRLKIEIVDPFSDGIIDTLKNVFPKMKEEDWVLNKSGFSEYITRGNRFFAIT